MLKWYNWINEILSGVGIVLGADVAQTKEIFGLILVVINVAVAVVSLVLKLVQWYKQAKADGQITKDEIDEAINIVNNSVDNIDKEASKAKKEKNDNE